MIPVRRGETSEQKKSRSIPGPIPGIPVGSTFKDRRSMRELSVHAQARKGISGTMEFGCCSIVINGGYEDDHDEGYSVIYSGAGGQFDANGNAVQEGPQTCHQSWDNPSNKLLAISELTKEPVRVIRGYKANSEYAPRSGYRYDGLYRVERAWLGVGKSGFNVCKVRLERLPNQPPIPLRNGSVRVDYSAWEQPRHFSASPFVSWSRAQRGARSVSRQQAHQASTSTHIIPNQGPKPPIPDPEPIPPTTNAFPARIYSNRRLGPISDVSMC